MMALIEGHEGAMNLITRCCLVVVLSFFNCKHHVIFLVQPRRRCCSRNRTSYFVYGRLRQHCDSRCDCTCIHRITRIYQKSHIFKCSAIMEFMVAYFSLSPSRARSSTACIQPRLCVPQSTDTLMNSVHRPLMNIIVPRSLLLKHPQLAANLQRNQGRLTSHYDFYLTIRHLTRLHPNLRRRVSLNHIAHLFQLCGIMLSFPLSGRWPEAEATSDMGMPFKDARSFMSEMPVEREVSCTLSLAHIFNHSRIYRCCRNSAAKLVFRKITAAATAMRKRCVHDGLRRQLHRLQGAAK